MSGPPARTVALKRLVTIAAFAGAGFAFGFMAMAFVNTVSGIGITLGSTYRTDAEYLQSQVIAGLAVSMASAVLGAAFTWKIDALETGRRIDRRLAAVALAVIIGGPSVARVILSRTAESAAMHEYEAAIRARGLAAFDEADSLWRMPRGPRVLSGILQDAAASPASRLTAGLTLIESKTGTPQDESEVDRLVHQTNPSYRTMLMDLYASGRTFDGDVPMRRWIREALQDPEPRLRAAALRALLANSTNNRSDSALCDPLDQLARAPDGVARAQAMLVVSVCPSDPTPLLRAGSRDTDPRVRLAVAQRAGWRLSSGTESPLHLTLREAAMQRLGALRNRPGAK